MKIKYIFALSVLVVAANSHAINKPQGGPLDIEKVTLPAVQMSDNSRLVNIRIQLAVVLPPSGPIVIIKPFDWDDIDA